MRDGAVKPKLLDCFRAVFSELDDDALMASSSETNEAWDSLAHVTLISVIEDEFGLEIPSDRADELMSFAALLAYLESVAA